MSAIPLMQSASGVLNAAGHGSVRMGPGIYGTSWSVASTVVTSNSTLDTTCAAYKNVESVTARIDATSNGNDDVSDTAYKLRTGETVLFVWDGGTPGAVVTATLTGDLETGR